MSAQPLHASAFVFGQDNPNKPAFYLGEQIISWAAYRKDICRATARLMLAVPGKGKRIVLLSDDIYTCAVTLMACLQAGHVFVPLNPGAPGAQITDLLDWLFPALILGDLPEDTVSPSQRVPADAYIAPGDDAAEAKLRQPNPDQPATLLFTSGSSAEPKAVLHNWSQHYESAVGLAEALQLRRNSVWVHQLPLHHAGGLAILLRAAVTGCAVSNSLSPAASHCSLVATQLRRLLNDAEALTNLRAMQCILVGGSYLPNDLLQHAIREGLPVSVSYGSTELASTCTASRPGESMPEQAAGRLLPGREVRIASDGEIHVRGKTLFQGYWTPQGLRQPLENDGWYATSDTGSINAQGILFVEGRKDNMFISGGENIQPEAIERAILGCEFVLDAIVVPVEDAEFGHRPAAFLRVKQNARLDTEALLEEVLRRLPRYCLPVAWFEMPASESGMLKPARIALRRLAHRLYQQEIRPLSERA